MSTFSSPYLKHTKIPTPTMAPMENTTVTLRNTGCQGLKALWSKIAKNTDKIAIQSITVPRVSGASEQANGRASGLVLQSVFLAVIDHSAREQQISFIISGFSLLPI